MSATRAAPLVLEPASQAFTEATANPPFVYELTPADARAVLDNVQGAPIGKLPVDEHWITVLPRSAMSESASSAPGTPRANCP